MTDFIVQLIVDELLTRGRVARTLILDTSPNKYKELVSKDITQWLV